MKTFIVSHPGVTESLLGALLVVVGALIRQSFNRLTGAIQSLEKSLAADRKDIGSLKDRMQKQETTCEMQREQCPNRTGQKISTARLIENQG